VTGILSIPEVAVRRGGFKYTQAVDFATIYAAVGFLQTETQAIAGTTKACFEIPCPTFIEVRLDAIGLCIKVPILMEAAYPELIQRWMSGALVAHQHKVNAQVLSRIATSLGTARVQTDMLGTAQSTFASIELLTDQLRQKFAMGMEETMEVVAPFWLEGALRSDLALRTGRNIEAITDAMIAAEFAVRDVNVQYVYDWQPLDTTLNTYPATVQLMIYPAGTYVKGTSDVIKLNAVYDAASLAVNIYTGLFFEEGLLVAKMCNSGVLATIAVNNSGRTGIANIAVADSA
jgi:hypothetical protein